MRHEAQGMRQEASKGYRLTNCVVLLGAVAGGEAAHPVVRERIRMLMGQAMTADKYLDAQGGRSVRREPSGVKALVEEIRRERLTARQDLLTWARERAASGRPLVGVCGQEPEGVRQGLPKRKPGGRGQTGETKAALVKLLAQAPATAKELAGVLGLQVNGTLLMLKRLSEASVVSAAGWPRVWKLGAGELRAEGLKDEGRAA